MTSTKITRISNVRIDPTSAQTWAQTWVARSQDSLPIYLQDFTRDDFLFDMVSGELPWEDKLNQEVVTTILSLPEYEVLRAKYTEAFGDDRLHLHLTAPAYDEETCVEFDSE